MTIQDIKLAEYIKELEKTLNIAPINTTKHNTPALVKYACALLTVIETKGATT